MNVTMTYIHPACYYGYYGYYAGCKYVSMSQLYLPQGHGP